ncbi:ABC transporter permease subunit [Bacillus sp. REN3]|uniref:ABC transporter permease subunit n=1 Tax=Bacillus sp. REN3 TaxID=2802440 RepID=UPI001AED1693|nr:ABC transporter permease subunit [Bacillus sp. REN3]
MINKLFVNLILWITSVFLFICILFLPANTQYNVGKSGEFISASYNYDFSQHIHNIEGFFIHMKENKGLGELAPGQLYSEKIKEKAGKSILLVIPALLLAFFIGIGKGIFDFKMRNKKLNFLGNGITLIFLSMPDIFFIIITQIGLMFLYEKGLFFHITLFGSEKIENYLICILFLSIYPIFYIANITHVSFKEEGENDYIRTAMAKGSTQNRILYIHMLKNSLTMILAHSNTITLYVLSNLFIVEKLTSFKGAAHGMFEAIHNGTSINMVDINIGLDGLSAFAYTVFFTFIIFGTNLLSQIGKEMVEPKFLESEQ